MIAATAAPLLDIIVDGPMTQFSLGLPVTDLPRTSGLLSKHVKLYHPAFLSLSRPPLSPLRIISSKGGSKHYYIRIGVRRGKLHATYMTRNIYKTLNGWRLSD